MSTINWDDPHESVTECQKHQPPMALDDACGDCVAEFNERNDINGRISRKVMDAVNNLKTQGVPPPPWMQADIRLQVLVEMVLDFRGRTIFEAEAGRRLYEALKGMQQDLTRAKLSGGASQGGLVVPGR